MKNFKVKPLLITLSVIMLVFYSIAVLFNYFVNTKLEYRNMTQEQKNEFNEKTIVSKEDFYKNQLLYKQTTDFILKNKIILISFDNKSYDMEVLDSTTGWFKKTECTNQCILENNMNILDVMKQLGIIRIVNTQIYPPEDEQKKYIIFVKDQAMVARGNESGYMRYFETIGRDNFVDNGNLIEPIDDHWAMFHPVGKRDKYGKLYPSD